MTRLITCFVFFLMLITSSFCKRNKQTATAYPSYIALTSLVYKTIDEIPTADGYERATVEKGSFGEWLRKVKLKEDSRVYLYSGRLRYDQSTQFAVLDMPVGNKDLQQCADAILRLRAEYFFEQSNMDSIHFRATGGTELSFAKWLNGERYKLNGRKLKPYMSSKSADNKRMQLKRFLEVVFSVCGTISLDRETRFVYDFSDIQIGDVLIKAGSTGHAMIVGDVAMNQRGEKIFMLAQGFMPAQDIHIVKNLTNEKISPWYKVGVGPKIITPQMDFL
jgi:hypothetical protein